MVFDSKPLESVRALMDEFAVRTGLVGEGLVGEGDDTRRYLWTDAFAVCNFLELHRRSGDRELLSTAIRLVDEVHTVLGKYRPDDVRRGWISGFDEVSGREHPTAGGLRIGKRHNERGPGEPYDDRLEWDLDGQYFHYLTRWMHALARIGAVTADARYLGYALELARVAHRHFVHRPSRDARPRMFWKMSIDLSRPQVASMGHHDPLDGLLTLLELCARADGSPAELELGPAVEDMTAMCAGTDWATADLLGLGGLLIDAYRCAQLDVARGMIGSSLLVRIVHDAVRGVAGSTHRWPFDLPADQRLAFRELGFAIGLHAVPALRELLTARAPDLARAVGPGLADLERVVPLAKRIEDFWLEERNQQSRSFQDHLDIDAVMLATSLAPDTYLQV